MASLRVVCLSDTHLRRPSALPAWCREHLTGADLIIHAGDFISRTVLGELERIAPVEAVRGNMDEAALGARLPLRTIATVGTVRVGIVHNPGSALGRAERLASEFPDCEAIVYGHTHVLEIERAGNRAGPLIVNPGSPTASRGMGATMIELLVSRSGDIDVSVLSG